SDRTRGEARSTDISTIESSRSIYARRPDGVRGCDRSLRPRFPRTEDPGPRAVVTTALVSTWFGAFLVEDGQVTRAMPSPLDPTSLSVRSARRRAGGLTPEEEELLKTRGSADWVTRDRRLAEQGLRFDPHSDAAIDATASGVDPTLQRTQLLGEA